VLTKQARIAEIADRYRSESLVSLGHHIDRRWLIAAKEMVRRGGAAGVDGVTALEYEKELEGNLRSLEAGMKSGRYKAPPVRRVYVPKGNGEKRPLGIPTYEDKIAQRAIQMILEPIYEQQFYDFSYGFRPGKSPHDALNRLWNEGRLSYGKAGTPQGGVISPLPSNIFLHEVLDAWFAEQVQPRLRGKAAMVRFDDDAVLLFETYDDLKWVGKVLGKRFEKYGLKLNEEKTKVRRFLPPGKKGEVKPEPFDFLGFTHYWGKSRKGNWVVKRKTQGKRLAKAVKTVAMWCRRYRHESINVQWKALNRKLLGHYAYYVLPQ
jgi:hypothetical protein